MAWACLVKGNIVLDILCVSDYFLPGFKGGGPITTLANMRKQIVGEITLSVFTRDRDLGAAAPYHEIVGDRWMSMPEGPVFYASPRHFGSRGLRLALSTGNFELVYLNSFFSFRGSIQPYLAMRRKGLERPFLIAPRGEFSPGALAVKRAKKKLFIRLARAIGLYRDVWWHASSEMEAKDILHQFPYASGKIHIAPDPVTAALPDLDVRPPVKMQDQLRIAFISRISPKKNLDGLLEILSHVNSTVFLDIYGPIEDEEYWDLCEGKICALPDNIHVKLHGSLSPDEVVPTFAIADLFAFPTHGENFGHVIFEAIRAGTPVLLSDQTPWTADEAGAVTVIPTSDKDAWSHAIEAAARRGHHDQERLRLATLDYASQYIKNDDSRIANLAMFRSVVSSRNDDKALHN